jgi:hypothetical protein
MRTTLFLLAISVLLLLATTVAADTMLDQLNGTWSGSWIPAGGVRDAMTIEFKLDDNARLTGRLVSPVAMDFTKVAFDTKAHSLLLEGTDPKSGKQYKVNAKVEPTEIKGTITVGTESGSIDLIKWTYVPRINGY